MSARDDLIEIVTRDPQSSGGDPTWATDLVDAHHEEALTEVTAWLVKKAREYRAEGTNHGQTRANTVAVIASKIRRGAVRPNNLLMLPEAGFFEVDRTYQREHHGTAVTFKVAAISTSPDGQTTVAHGWRSDPYSGWEPTDSDDMTGWTEVTEEVTS